MKQIGYRFWLANMIMVLSFIVLVVTLLGWLIPAFTQPFRTLFPVVAIVCSSAALLFAAIEAVYLYRSWKQSAGERQDADRHE